MADYFLTLEKEERDFQMMPVVRDALRGQDVYVKEYSRYLEDKHL